MYSMYPPAVTPLLSLVLLNSSLVAWPAMVVDLLLSGGVAVLLAVVVAAAVCGCGSAAGWGCGSTTGWGCGSAAGWWYLTCLSSTFDCHHSDGVVCTIVQSCQVVVGAITCSVD